ncbi:MAG TPA: chloride channel protein [Acidimicrobiales bacterium]
MSARPGEDALGEAPHPSRSVHAREYAAAVGRWIRSASYLQRWIVLGVAIGAIAGLGAVAFYEALRLCTHFFLEILAGYSVPTPAGEGHVAGATYAARPWVLPLVAGSGALLGALLVYRFAPEAEGHGTDAAIAAVHHNPKGVRFRAVVVKIVASALTIGSGGSGGREGPTGQISAGFGSLLTRVLDLDPADGRIAVATGIGSGIGAIFGAPLGGAVLASEILYRDDFDPAALLPCFIASSVSYAVFASFEGFGPLFGYVGSYRFGDPAQLGWFALIGVLGGLIGLLYAKGFYGIAQVSAWIPRLPRWVKPAIGGLLVGSIGIVIPEVLGTGYGWVQKSLGPELLGIPLWIVLIVPFARIVATGLSIGTGGSGGIFGPGMVIGAFMGAAVWRLFEPIAPSMGHDPSPYVIVGMMCCFGSISRAPLAVMLMVAEMTGSLSILTPALVGVGLAWLIVHHFDDSIYRSQIRSRADTEVRRLTAGLPLLAAISTRSAMAPVRLVLPTSTTVRVAIDLSRVAGVSGAPVLDEAGRFEGTVAVADLAATQNHRTHVGDVADAGAPAVTVGSQLDAALESIASAGMSWVPVLDDDRRVVGILSISDLVTAYRRELLASAQRVSALGARSGAFELSVTDDSGLAGHTLRSADLPEGTFVTSIARNGRVVTPNGDVLLEPGDRLSLLGYRARDVPSPVV